MAKKKRMFKVKEQKQKKPLPGSKTCPKCKTKNAIFQSHYHLQPTVQCAICGLFYMQKGSHQSLYQQCIPHKPSTTCT